MSIIFANLIRQAQGNLPVVVGPPVVKVFSQGLALDENGSVWISGTAAIDHYAYGLPFSANDELCVKDEPIAYYDQGIGFTASGRISVSPLTEANYFNQGVGFNMIGGIYVTGIVHPSLPPQVLNLIVTIPVDNQFHAVWDAVVATPIVTNYTLQYKLSGDIVWTDISTGTNLFGDGVGLLSGEQYDIRVYATNLAGNGPASVTVQQIVEGVPQAPSNFIAIAGIELTSLVWTGITAAPAISALTIEYKLTSSGTWISFPRTGLLPNQTIYNLYQGGQSYDFRVRGTNAKGNGAYVTGSATPTLIVPAKVLELNERGLLSAPIRVNNTGTAGASRDFLNQVGAGTALSLQTHKNKNCWQSVGQRALQTGGIQTAVAQPSCFWWVGIPFFLDASNYRVIWSSPSGSPDGAARTAQTTLFAGAVVNGPPLSTDSVEWIIFWRLNGASSSVRCIKNNGVTDSTITGNASTAQASPFILNWNPSLAANRDFGAQVYDFGWFTGSLSVAEETSKINAMKQKWFIGIDGQ